MLEGTYLQVEEIKCSGHRLSGVCACSPSTWEEDTQGSEIQGQPVVLKTLHQQVNNQNKI